MRWNTESHFIPAATLGEGGHRRRPPYCYFTSLQTVAQTDDLARSQSGRATACSLTPNPSPFTVITRFPLEIWANALLYFNIITGTMERGVFESRTLQENLVHLNILFMPLVPPTQLERVRVMQRECKYPTLSPRLF